MSELDSTKGRRPSIPDIAGDNPKVDIDAVERALAILDELRLAGVKPQTYKITSAYESQRQAGSRAKA